LHPFFQAQGEDGNGPKEFRHQLAFRGFCRDAFNEAKALKPLARLEDLSVYKVEKKGKKGKTNEYWHATWRHGHEVCNVYLGSCKKLAREQALQKAKKMKAEDLGIKGLSVSFNDKSLKMA